MQLAGLHYSALRLALSIIRAMQPVSYAGTASYIQVVQDSCGAGIEVFHCVNKGSNVSL
jgi:hypothetical protein